MQTKCLVNDMIFIEVIQLPNHFYLKLSVQLHSDFLVTSMPNDQGKNSDNTIVLPRHKTVSDRITDSGKNELPQEMS